MANRMRNRGFRRGGGFSPASDWGAFAAVGTLTAGVGGTAADLYDLTTAMDSTPNDTPETVLRIRGAWLAWMVTEPAAAVGDRWVGIGIGVESAAALTGGNVPLPLTDAYWDGWMLHRVLLVHSLPAALVGTVAPNHGSGSPMWELDTQAMRRLEDDSLYLAIEMQTDSGAADVMRYWLNLRALFRESSRR